MSSRRLTSPATLGIRLVVLAVVVLAWHTDSAAATQLVETGVRAVSELVSEAILDSLPDLNDHSISPSPSTQGEPHG